MQFYNSLIIFHYFNVFCSFYVHRRGRRPTIVGHRLVQVRACMPSPTTGEGRYALAEIQARVEPSFVGRRGLQHPRPDRPQVKALARGRGGHRSPRLDLGEAPMPSLVAGKGAAALACGLRWSASDPCPDQARVASPRLWPAMVGQRPRRPIVYIKRIKR